MNDNIQVVILAGGLGKRMKSDLPKALIPFLGKPMLGHLLESVRRATDVKPILVVGYGKEEIKEKFGDAFTYVTQERQLGTGHALLSARDVLKKENTLVLYVDHPLVSPETIKKLAQTHLDSGAVLTLATAKVPDFEDWREIFYTNFSRIVRDTKGNIMKDVQFKDATEEEKKIPEINPVYLCARTSWLLEKLKTLENDNAQGEYYLTDLVDVAVKENVKISSIEISPREALGVNSKEELAILEKL